MAPLRFRCWNPVDKKMGTDITLDFLAHLPDLNLPTLNESLRQATQLGLIVMQSTGLFDKNEKEIFEGDVMRVPHDWENGKPKTLVNAQVNCEEYDDGEQYGDRSHFGWILKYSIKDYETRITLSDGREYGEVIGNVHETPDFLLST